MFLGKLHFYFLFELKKLFLEKKFDIEGVVGESSINDSFYDLGSAETDFLNYLFYVIYGYYYYFSFT